MRTSVSEFGARGADAYIKSMASSKTYALFEQAMRSRKQIACTYKDYHRELCAIILGHSRGERESTDVPIRRSEQPRTAAPRCMALSLVGRSHRPRIARWAVVLGRSSHAAVKLR